MRKLGFMKKLGFIIGVIVLLMAVIPMSDGLAVQAGPEDWYYKPGDWVDYAPSGVPDFAQQQHNWTDTGTPAGKWCYCGPVAVANSLWYFDSVNDPNPPGPPALKDNYHLVTSYGPWDDHNVSNVRWLVEDLAMYMMTGPTGTNVMDMQRGIDQYLIDRCLYGHYYEKTEQWPDFYKFIEPEVERCEDVILLLGFWKQMGEGPDSYYERYGGHYVTCAGVNSADEQIGISDPYYDNAEVTGIGRVLPPVPPHPPAGHNATVHNDTLYVSHDTYDVIFIPSHMGPMGFQCWALPNYANNKDITNFLGLNGGGGDPGIGELVTIIDYAVAVSPKEDLNEMIDTDYNWTTGEQEDFNVSIRVHVTNETWNETINGIYDLDIGFWTEEGTEWVEELYFVDPLVVCTNYTFNVSWFFPPKMVVLHFSNYTGHNIGFAFSYYVDGLPDLMVGEKFEEVVGCEYYVNYTVFNAGFAPAGASTTGIYADGELVGTADCPPLGVCEWHTTTTELYECPGNTIVWIEVCADDGGIVEEEWEDNNCMGNWMEQPLEFGDAPDPTYPSKLASDGARHCPTDTEILGLNFSQGDSKDFELDARVTDLDIPYSDGLAKAMVATNDTAATVQFEVTNWGADNLVVNILIDLNRDWDWDDPGEHVVQNQSINLPSGEGTFTSNTFNTTGAKTGPTWLRLTLTRTPVAVPWNGTGLFDYGETEDYLIYMQEEGWYWKPDNWTDYALSGVPDFDQKQNEGNWRDPAGGQWYYCGPVAVANSLWYFDSREETGGIPPPDINDTYDLVTSYNTTWDDHDPRNVIPLVDELAGLMGTNPTGGTNVFDMQRGIDQYLVDTGYYGYYYEHTEPYPYFPWIEDEIKRCEDVILLLGFWQTDSPDPWNSNPYDWWRIGGHYVTCAGVNSDTGQLGICDPFFDNAEATGQGIVRVPHSPHPGDSTVHNDTQYVSHDIYWVVPSPSPGGEWGLEGYAFGKEMPDILNFENQNGEPSMEPYNEMLDVYTEIEYAVVMSPKDDLNKVIDSDYYVLNETHVSIRVHVTNETWNETINGIYDMDVLLWNSTIGTQVPWPHRDFDPPLVVCENYTFNVSFGCYPPEKNVVLHFSNKTGENIGFAFSYPPTATLVGNVTFWRTAKAPHPTWETPLVVSFFNNTTRSLVLTKDDVITDANGNFTIDGIPPDTYDIGIKNWTCLSKMKMNVTINASETKVVSFGTPVEGDCYHVGMSSYDIVTFKDYLDVLKNYRKDYWQADFNRNGIVDFKEYLEILKHYRDRGDISVYKTP